MEYARTIVFRGDLGKAFDAASATLLQHGFVVTGKRLSTLELAGPGLNSTRQPPILGATTIVLEGDQGWLRMEADLGGVAAMRRFLYLLPLGLGTAFILVFGVGMGFLFGRQFGVSFGVPWAPGWQWLSFVIPLSVLPLTPWLVLSPLVARRTRRRTISALDAFLSSLQLSPDRPIAAN